MMAIPEKRLRDLHKAVQKGSPQLGQRMANREAFELAASRAIIPALDEIQRLREESSRMVDLWQVDADRANRAEAALAAVEGERDYWMGEYATMCLRAEEAEKALRDARSDARHAHHELAKMRIAALEAGKEAVVGREGIEPS